MEITFTNDYGKILTEQQLQIADSYIKVFKENNRLRKKEFFDNNLLSNSIYYLEYGTPHNELLNLNLEYININEMEEVNTDYTKYHAFRYKGLVLKNKGISIRTKPNDDGIMTQYLNLLTNLPIYHTTTKYYEDQNTGYEFEMNYFSTGELRSIIVSNDAISFYEQYRPSEIGLIPNFEWWNLYSSYYLNAEPAVPNGIIFV